MKKKLNRIIAVALALVMACALIPGFAPEASAANAPSFIKVNGEKLAFPDEQPYIENGTTLVPLRFIAEALEFDVEWEQSTYTVLISKGDINMRLPIGSTTVYVNGEEQTVPKAAILKNERTFVPLRYVSEVLNCTVDWWSLNNGITINALRENGTEELWSERFKQSELFVDEQNMGRYLQPISGEGYHIALSNLELNPGFDCYIEVDEPTLETRREVYELLKTIYPTRYDEVYQLYKETVLGTGTVVVGSFGTPTSGTFKEDYDGKVVWMLRAATGYTAEVAIELLEPGADPYEVISLLRRDKAYREPWDYENLPLVSEYDPGLVLWDDSTESAELMSTHLFDRYNLYEW